MTSDLNELRGRSMATVEDNLHPDLLNKIQKVLTVMRMLDFPMKIVQGVRTTTQQASLYAKGRTEKGPIVTNADGVIKKSNHQVKADGFGYAVDCAFEGPEPFAESHPWDLYGACVRAVGLEWGVDWKSFVDRP